MKKFEVRRFGSFWAGDLTRTDDRPALYTKNNILRFGDSTVDESVNIPWEWVGDKWISKATVLTNITWNELDAFGFTRGRPVRIDGDLYYCRCPHLDVNPDSCEFRQAVNESGQGNEFWTWQGHYFMGDRTIGMEDNKGTVHPCYWMEGMHPYLSRAEYMACSERNCFVGFRPVLERLCPKNRDLVGRDVTVWTDTWKFAGHLRETNLYDLVLDGCPDTERSDSWKEFAVVDNGRTIVDLEKVIYMG